MDKQEKLDALEAAWQSRARCPHLCESRTNIVFGYGNPNAQIMVIGEAPWTDEDRYGLPFVGFAGQTLDSLLAAVSVDPRLTGEGTEPITRPDERREVLLEEYYYCNLIMCKPTGEKIRAPNKKEVENCRTRLNQQIYIVDPVLILGTGASVLEALTGKRDPITSRAGEVIDIIVPGKLGNLIYPFMPVIHPSYLNRQGNVYSKDFTLTYNYLVRAQQILDVYNYEMFGVDPPANRPVPEAVSPEEEEENAELAKKLAQRRLITDRVMEAHHESDEAADSGSEGHEARRRKTDDEPDDGEDWAESLDAGEED